MTDRHTDYVDRSTSGSK